MNKQEVQQRVLQDGEPLDLDKFEWNGETKTFSTAEHELVLDFSGVQSVAFGTGGGCTFKTGSGRSFTTRWGCTPKTCSHCTFIIP